MPLAFTTLAQVLTAPFDTVIDVRSPAEYAEDHIPGAISLPALSNAERARVGTIYTQDTPFNARKIGAALVARNVAGHLETALADKPGGWQPLVYCWRGGQRSGSFASILTQIGWRAQVIEGGYRSYRRLVVQAMHDAPLPHRLVLLDGNTGTAKTELLALLAERGAQVVDLEGLAAHRGSLLGGVARPQPSQKAFEGALARAFNALDPARPVVVEAESSKIGSVLIPGSVWRAMRAAPRFQIHAPLAARAAYLARAYADLTEEAALLAERLNKLVPFQGHDRVTHWQNLARDKRFEELASELMAQHYVRRYDKSRKAAQPGEVHELSLDGLQPADLDRAADGLIAMLDQVTVMKGAPSSSAPINAAG